ncbi:MAG: carboxypeptidase-like regulatory domain-containing protein [Mucilaginibacter sp.]
MKKIVSKKEYEMSPVEKYLAGSFDMQAAHQAGRKQQASLVMDATAGYENAVNSQPYQLYDLSVHSRQRKMLLWIVAAIAATIIGVFVLGGFRSRGSNGERVANEKLTFVKQKTISVLPGVKKNQTAASRPLSHSKHDKKATLIIVNKKAVEPVRSFISLSAGIDTDNDETGALQSDSTSANEVVVMGMAGQNTQPSPNEAASTYSNSPLKKIAGVIVDKDNGLPIPGASVSLAGTKISTVTDDQGKFILSVDKGSVLVITSIGYNTLKINAPESDSLKTIALEPSQSSITEMIATGYTPKKISDKKTTVAHPTDGWEKFKSYLKENAASPDGKTGVVKLSFMVDQNGAISEIAIIKGLSAAADKKAIDLVTNGPAWTGNASGQTEQVQASIRFE